MAPQTTILRSDGDGIVLRVDVMGFDIKSFETEGNTYQSIDLLTDMFTTIPGSPELPYIAHVLAIPDKAGVTVEVIEKGEMFSFSNIDIAPARSSWVEGSEEPPYSKDLMAYKLSNPFPSEMASMDRPSIMRDFRISRLAVFPVRYIPEKAELQVYSSITVKVNYHGGEVVNPKTSPQKRISPSFAQLYKNTIFNYEQVLNERYAGKEDGKELMLCIMPDIFYDSFLEYAEWKRESGIDVHITKFSEINATASNPNTIKNYISDVYQSWEDRPTYVLIVGDDGIFPKKIVTYPAYSFAWEDFFVAVDGDDYFPEMMIGRFTNKDNNVMQIMMNKFKVYEKYPYTEDPTWIKKATCCSNNQYESQVQTKRFVADVLLQNGRFLSVDTMMSNGYWGSNCTYSITDIINALNQGRSFLNYRGEGWAYGWYASCYNFGHSEVMSLNNGQKMPFVTSIGCGVAMFDYTSGNCFGEDMIELGTINNPRGAVSFVGATSNTHTTYNNRIDKGMYIGMFQEGMETPGQALLRGKLYMYNVFGNEYYVEYHYKVFCTLGDPSIHIWKNVPQEVNIDFTDLIYVGQSTAECVATYETTGFPVVNGTVTITGDDVFVSGNTDETGKVIFDFIAPHAENLTITVRGDRVKPKQGTIEVQLVEELIGISGEPIIEDIDGNNDGQINPNETCNIVFALKNWGELEVKNIQATLSSSDEYITILTTDPVSYGSLAPNESKTGDPFQFVVKPNCPIGYAIPIVLHVSSFNSSWDYSLTLSVKGCSLKFDNFLVFDSLSTNMNYRMDPGETTALLISITNIGDDLAYNVKGILTCNDPNITIIEPNSSFGSIPIGRTAYNRNDAFIVGVKDNCPAGYVAIYNLKICTEDANYPYEASFSFSIPVSKQMSTDYTGPDGYGYYAYSNDDTFYKQRPEYKWAELNGSGTQIQLPQQSDFTTTIKLPFNFKYYGIVYDQIRVSTDGWIALGPGMQTIAENSTIPSNDEVNCMVAVFWDDLYDNEFFLGKIYYQHDVTNHRFIIQWDGISHNNFVDEPVREYFQAILLDPQYYPTRTGDGEIIFQYKEIHDTKSVTVGIENHSQNVGIQYVYNTKYHPTATSLGNAYAIKFTTTAPTVAEIVSVGPEIDPGLFNKSYALLQNYPNPFGDVTSIGYVIKHPGYVKIDVFSITGQLIRTLISGNLPAGSYSVTWNGKNNYGVPVPPGMYIYRLQTENSFESKRMIKY